MGDVFGNPGRWNATTMRKHAWMITRSWFNLYSKLCYYIVRICTVAWMYIQPYILAEFKYIIILLLFFKINSYIWVQAQRYIKWCSFISYCKKDIEVACKPIIMTHIVWMSWSKTQLILHNARRKLLLPFYFSI